MASEQLITIIGSFLISFKAVLLEGSEVAILSLATLNQVGTRNAAAGIIFGLIASFFIFLGVRELFSFLPSLAIDFVAGAILLYFSRKFLSGFIKYYTKRKVFSEKIEKETSEIISKEKAILQRRESHLSLLNTIPIFTITLTEGFEASIVLATAGTISIFWTAIGAITSITLISLICVFSYKYLMNFPRWLLDLIAGLVLLSFGTIFIITGTLEVLTRT